MRRCVLAGGDRDRLCSRRHGAALMSERSGADHEDVMPLEAPARRLPPHARPLANDGGAIHTGACVSPERKPALKVATRSLMCAAPSPLPVDDPEQVSIMAELPEPIRDTGNTL